MEISVDLKMIKFLLGQQGGTLSHKTHCDSQDIFIVLVLVLHMKAKNPWNK